ncbi:monooxygenase [Purpureocillium lilacinum]|uniref:Monooxygenase n=1 Tax=Purpureocillium lilacinum TaxID=33203 RepID=A0A179GDI2_PURLI|nr:monooxygenase [Purpureocillium lilacinum]OAQ75852.1 monooxygenase [Purpureocillium lilacinum]
MDSKTTPSKSYSQFACIGTGFSAICLGATLQRWYNNGDIAFFEKHSQLGGTWFANTYPGCACDVPSVLYSYSFEPNSNWSRILPPQSELWAYLKGVSDKYSLTPKMSFNTTVVKCEWLDDLKRWRLHVRHQATDTLYHHDCQFLFAAAGQLATPRDIGVPGAESFSGPIFHSSEWRHDVDLDDKNVIVIGNGCTAAQIVPSIVDKTKHLTQIVRSKHWIQPPIDASFPTFLMYLFKIPGVMTLLRFIVYLLAENELRGFPLTNAAANFRKRRRAQAERYMTSTAPVKYHDMLIPDFEIGCKRRIFDSGYLKSLHSEKLELTNETILEIVPDGVRTKGRAIKADVIVLANGYATNKFLQNMEVVGKRGNLTQHWDEFGGAEAYNCSALSGFPNFFILLGPNAATGHTSAIMAAENSVNYALRIIQPVLSNKTGVVELKRQAEEQYVSQIQHDLSKTVWNSGCQSWYVRPTEDGGKTWNAMSYPYSQAHYWYRSVFATWSDWTVQAE